MKRWAVLIVRVLVSASLLVLFYRHVSFLDVERFSARLRFDLLPVLFLLLFINTLLSCWKWGLLLKAAGVHQPFGRLLGSYLAGSFLSVFLPSTIGGDLYRTYDIGRLSARPGRSLASTVAERLTGFLALVIIGFVSAVAGFAQHGDKRLVALPVTVFACLAACVWLVYQRRLAERLLQLTGLRRLPRLVAAADRFFEAFVAYRQAPGLFIPVMGLSFLFQFNAIGFVFLLAQALNIPIGFPFFLIFVPLISILEAIPLTIYGMGLREAGYVLFFDAVAVPRYEALSLSLAYVALTLIYAGLGGLVLLWRSVAGKAAPAVPPRTAGLRPPTPVVAVMLRHIEDKGGITVYTRNILQQMLAIGDRPRFALLAPSLSSVREFERFSGVDAVALGPAPSEPAKLWWDQVLVPRALARLGAAAVFNPKLSLPLRASCTGLFTMHGLEQFAAPGQFMWRDRLYFSSTMRLYCRKADAILCMTEAGRGDLARFLGVPPGKVHVIPESYNELCRPVADPARLAAVRDRYRLPPRFVLFVGGITPLKNIPALLAAFKLLRAAGRPHKLVIIGFRRWGFEDDLAAIQRLGLGDDVMEIGFVPDEDLPAIYSAADAFSLPSFYEGFGIPILEAQACGCPVVTSDVGPMREVAGGAALHFPAADAAAQAACLGRVLDDDALRRSLVEGGLRNAARYNWRRTAEATLKVVEGLL